MIHRTKPAKLPARRRKPPAVPPAREEAGRSQAEVERSRRMAEMGRRMVAAKAEALEAARERGRALLASLRTDGGGNEE